MNEVHERTGTFMMGGAKWRIIERPGKIRVEKVTKSIKNKKLEEHKSVELVTAKIGEVERYIAAATRGTVAAVQAFTKDRTSWPERMVSAGSK